jgi:sec-independent protein translocase protein TatA
MLGGVYGRSLHLFGLKTTELLIIFAALLLLFGATRLPQLGKSLGSSIRNFKKGISTDEEEEESVADNGKAAANKNLEAKSSASTSEVNSSKLGSKS